MPFKNVYLEVIGKCNGGCQYCVTGAGNANPGGIMQVNTLNATLQKLEKLNLINSQSFINLYNWGEPLLHPDLQGIIQVINHHNLRYSISTNGSIVPQINDVFIKNLIHIRFSMCGFSQQSYNRIHKFNFNRITQNISTIVSQLRTLDYNQGIEIYFHVYRFNTKEIRQCEKFANDLGVFLLVGGAFLNDWWQFEEFIQGTLSSDKYKAILDDIFLDKNVIKEVQDYPEGWRCPQWDILIIDERGDVATCCVLPNNHPMYSLGTIDENTICRLRNRPNLSICKVCMKSGIAYLCNTGNPYPLDYSLGFKQRWIQQRMRVRQIIKYASEKLGAEFRRSKT